MKNKTVNPEITPSLFDRNFAQAICFGVRSVRGESVLDLSRVVEALLATPTPFTTPNRYVT